MDMRTGVRLPSGDATGETGDSLADRYSWQVPFVIGLGVKTSPKLYFGGYLGFGFGAEGDDARVEQLCDDNDGNLENDIVCSAFSFEIGAQLTYSFEPAERWNPWISYGIGYEVTTQSLRARNTGYQEETAAHGITLAKLGVGADYRAGVGIGPFGEVAIGRFTHTSTDVSGQDTYEAAVEDPAFHAWISIGLRLVIFP